jgi:23S rRNA (cytosine1962-C5)-methyltransferase
VRRLATRVTPDALRRVRAGHPWIFDRSITRLAAGGAPGDLAVVFDERRRFVAIGLYDPESPIRIKVLHRGAPTLIDGAFWRRRLAGSLARRDALARSGHTDAYRVVHGENDGLPGLVLDRYGDVAVLKLYTAAWFAHLDEVVAAVDDVVGPRSLVLRLARNVGSATGERARGAPADGHVLLGEAPGTVRFLERGLRFAADPVAGQKTGSFLDQRDNRHRVRRASRGARVLDAFSCAGGFSVNAAAGGAQLVHSVDLSAAAIDAAVLNMSLNRSLEAVRRCRHHTTVGDAATVMADMAAAGRRFDLVVVDPPAFATRRDQVRGALAAYGRLTGLALDLLEPGGLLVQASCSSRVSVEDLAGTMHAAAERRGRRLDEVVRTGQPLDHPVGFPEGAYLCAVFATVAPGSRGRL